MSAPTNQDKQEMERLKKIMEGDFSGAREIVPQSVESGAPQTEFGPGNGPSSEDISAMANILKKFHGSPEQPVKKLMEKSEDDEQLREAMVTRKTDHGVKIGSWEIRKIIREGVTGKDETYYRLHNDSLNQIIKQEFFILEAAKAVVKLLNRGANIASNQIIDLLKKDEQYQRMRQIALEEKVRYTRAKRDGNEFKQDLYEAKFDASRAKALLLKEQIKNINLSV